MASTWCPSCYQNSYPEAPDITINETNLTIDDTPAVFKDEYVLYSSGALATDKKTVTLGAYPYEPQSVQVFKNALNQRQGTDFIVTGNLVVLTVALTATDEIHISYFALLGASTASIATGVVVSSAATSMTGYLAMDGATAFNKATYTALWDFLVTNSSLLETYTAPLTAGAYTGTFTLIKMQSAFYNGSTLVTLNGFIKT
jgi:hypothetical protein